MERFEAMSRGEMVAAAPVMAAAAYYALGVLDRPWVRRYLCISMWPSVAVCYSVVSRRRRGGEAGSWRAVGREVVAIWACSRAASWVVGVRRLTWREAKAGAARAAVTLARSLPVVSSRVEAEFAKIEAELRVSLKKEAGLLRALPEEPLQSATELSERLRSTARGEDVKWQEGLVSGAVYHGEAAHLALLNEAMAAYCVANPLHPEVWPSVTAMEAEIVSMTARLVDGGDRGVCGCMTSGGTESIILATKAHRDLAREERGVSRGEVVACATAHAAVEKACDVLGLRLVLVPARDDMRLDLAAMRRAVTADTILLYASAPQFPHGVVDDVAAVSELARAHGVGCHVDCCLGGFILPFLPEAPPFDFALPGVTSMSVDTHKYGYSPKGTSVVLYRSPRYRKYQYFCFPDWTGGLYATATLPGSRSGSLVAATWASLVSIGRAGFERRARDICAVANRIAAGVARMPHLKLLGADETHRVPAMIVCFASDVLDIYAVNDAMTKKGWSLNTLQHPPCVHICCTLRTLPDKFLADLAVVVDDLAAAQRGTEAPTSRTEGSAGIYGMASSMPSGPVADVMRIFIDLQLGLD
mmetsp:Transcript_4747/g.14349  ORF Transcript_4747/g.14349 Transcript_4747/m.14349 type:complete len:587 (-) Transcript_4747:174-1934(-)